MQIYIYIYPVVKYYFLCQHEKEERIGATAGAEQRIAAQIVKGRS